MSNNPFPNRFDSTCDSCGDDLPEGEIVFAVDGDFVCLACADSNGNVCDCGQFKKEEYDSCFDCYEKMKSENEDDYNL